MPPMRLFGRRWAVGSDDFVFPALTEVFYRAAWLFLTICIVVVRLPSTCSAKYVVDWYLLVAMLHNGLVLIHCIYMAHVSSRGTIYNAIPRRRIAKLLYVRCALFLVDVVLALAGCLVASKASAASGETGCSSTYIILLNLFVASAWLMVVLVLFEVWVVFDPLGRHHPDELHASSVTPQIWRSRLQTIFCCFGGNDRSRVAFEDAAEVFSLLFGDVDLVFTDIWAGLILLADKRNNAMRNRETNVHQEAVSPPWMNMSAARRYVQFALGVYGWPYYLCNSTCSVRPLVDLVRRLRFCYHCRCDRVLVIKDNCCLCNTVAFMLQTNLDEPDLFYVNYKNEIWETPFIACVDHSTQTIVIAIRGSLSLRDAFTDLCVSEDVVDVVIQSTDSNESVPHKAFVHRGILKSANYVHQKLIGENIIDDLFVLYPQYNLVITGHSLGGGVAAVLGLLLKPAYPKVRCFAFSPPGCVVDDVTNIYLCNFVCTVIFGDDFVCRMSYHSMLDLKAMVKEALEQCNRPKYELLVRGCFRWVFQSRRFHYETLDEEPCYAVQTTSSNSLQTGDQSHRLFSRPKPTYSTGSVGLQMRPKLCCPGQIFHLTSGANSTVNVRKCKSEDLREVLLTNTMVIDHMPQTVLRALQSLSLVKDV